MTKTIGLALEGGGGKGAYQVGAYMGLLEEGYKFDYIVGTSIGAINGVMMVQDQVELLAKIWSNISNSKVLEVDEDKYNYLIHEKLSPSSVIKKARLLRDLIESGGISTSAITKLLDDFVDEDLVRRSPIEFGLSTINLAKRLYEEVFISDMPRGTLKEYILTSSNLPVFNYENSKIEDYLDAGFYKNNPFEMLLGRCDLVINILIYDKRLHYRARKSTGVDIIKANQDLGHILDFDKNISKQNIKLGYYDALRYVNSYRGEAYYIERLRPNLAKEIINEAIKNTRNLNLLSKAKIFYQMQGNLTDEDYEDFIVSILEEEALDLHIERFKIYSAYDLAKIIYEKKISLNRSWKDIAKKEVIESILKLGRDLA